MINIYEQGRLFKGMDKFMYCGTLYLEILYSSLQITQVHRSFAQCYETCHAALSEMSDATPLNLQDDRVPVSEIV